MATWADKLHDYRVMAWNDRSGPNRKFFKQALKHKAINAHNFIGLWALWEYGGVMLDNDVEVLRPFDLEHGMFVGFQRSDVEQYCINNSVIGATPKHPLIGACLSSMEHGLATGDPLWYGCGILSTELRHRGMKGINVEQKLGDVMIYDKERFYPHWYTEKLDRSKLTDRTFSIHHWQGTWNK